MIKFINPEKDAIIEECADTMQEAIDKTVAKINKLDGEHQVKFMMASIMAQLSIVVKGMVNAKGEELVVPDELFNNVTLSFMRFAEKYPVVVVNVMTNVLRNLIIQCEEPSEAAIDILQRIGGSKNQPIPGLEMTKIHKKRGKAANGVQ